MTDGRVLAVGASGDAGAVFAALSAAYTVHAEPAVIMRWTWLDTADWRLHRAGLALREERCAGRRDLVVDRPGAPAVDAPVRGVRWPARLDHLGPSPVRDAIAGAVGVRALLPVAEVETRRILMRLMDAAGKTRVRVSVDQQRLLVPHRAALPLHVAVRPLRGYDDDARRCVQLLADAMGASSTELSPTDAALAAAGRLPGRASGADDVVISPTDPAVRPVAKALLEHVAVVDDARDGALADHDTEYLHELRSAIRSTRALLSAAGHLLLGRSAVRVERDLAWLDEMTTPLRAVDLALLTVADDAPDPHGLLPGLDTIGGAGALEPLREQLHRRRRAELGRMRRTLRAPRAPAAFTAWRRDLLGMLDADVIGPSAVESARTLATASHAALVGTKPDNPALAAATGALREVLAAFAVLYPAGDALARLRRDTETLHQLLRRRDGLGFVRDEVRTAASADGMPTGTVLAAGALADRAERLRADHAARIAAAHARIGGAGTARRLAAITGASA
ncbi:CHAD domain-containing protein [Jatrophihabitans fulvus]